MRNEFENAVRRKNRLSLAAEVFLSVADELADSLLYREDGEGFLKENVLQSDAFLSAYTEARDSLCFTNGVPPETPPETAPFLSSFREDAERLASVYLLAAFCRKREEAGYPISISDFLDGNGEPENSKIAYMRNAYSDAAYSVFSKGISGASVLYPSSFASACEEVYYGRAGYCILPYESSEEGVLSGFRRLISKYELSPVLTCTVITDVSTQTTTRFALLAKSAVKIGIGRAFSEKTLNRYLKITVGGPQEKTSLKVLTAASLCGLKCTKTESVPLTWDEGSYAGAFTFSLNGGNPAPFLLYLYLEVPESEIDGIYTDIIG